MTTIATETRTQGIQLRDLETTLSKSMLKGRAVPYNREEDIGWFLETFAPGSLAKSIKESARALPLLLFHESRSWPIGVAHEYDDNDDGLDTIWRLDKSAEAQRAAQLAEDGILNFLSIRFSPIRSQWTYVDDFNPDLGAAHKDRVLRQEARLIETSLVSTPAYNGAAVEWVRTGERSLTRPDSGREIRAWRDELEALRAGATR